MCFSLHKKKIFFLNFLVSNIISNKLMFVRSQKLNLSSKGNNVRLVIKWKKNNLGRWIIINWMKKKRKLETKRYLKNTDNWIFRRNKKDFIIEIEIQMLIFKCFFHNLIVSKFLYRNSQIFYKFPWIYKNFLN
jgi:hypothetical protein